MGARTLAWYGLAGAIMVAEGAALSRSELFAAPLLGVLLVLIAADVPAIPFLGGVLIVRVVADALTDSASRQSASVNLSALVALVLIAMAVGVLLRRPRGTALAFGSALFLGLWTAIAVPVLGVSTILLREGVRALSIAAIAVIVLCAPRLRAAAAARIVQFAGIVPAALAFLQVATGAGMEVDGALRSYGTFSHPNSAALYFGIAAVVSLWCYLDGGRRWFDAVFAAAFVGAAITTFSLGGIAALVVMLLVFGVMRRGTIGVKVGAWAAAAALVVVFVATPVGAQRLASQSSTDFSASAQGASTNSLEWRFYNWGTLLPAWRDSPIVGQGIGTTLTGETATGDLPHNEYVRLLVETGIVGVAVVAAALIALMRALFRRRRTGVGGGIAAMALAILAGCLVNALTSNTLLYTPAAYAAAIVVAAALRSTETRSTRAQVSAPETAAP